MNRMLSIAGCLVVLGGSAALAQNSTMPAGPKSGPQSATGAAPTRDVGQMTPTVAETPTGKTTSSSMMQQKKKAGRCARDIELRLQQQQAVMPG